METDEDITVYSWAYYLHYSQGDDKFAEFLKCQDGQKAETNRKILRWVDCDGHYHSVNLPEKEWRSIVYKEFPDPPKPVPGDEKDPAAEPVADPAAEPAADPAEPAAEEGVAEPSDDAPSPEELEELERRRAAERAKMREKCMLAAETRRWDIRGWSQRKRRTDDGKEVSIVPSLSELAERALQTAFEMTGEDLRMHPLYLAMKRFPTPVDHNGELCRVFRGRPAVE